MSAGGARRGRRDNGLDAAEYAVAGDVDPRVGEHLLDVLAAGGIAAYLLPASDLNPITRTTTVPARPTDRLFVDRTYLSVARDHLARLAAEERRDTDRRLDIEAEWARIVAGFDVEVAPGAQPWPDAENLDDSAGNQPTGFGPRRGPATGGPVSSQRPAPSEGTERDGGARRRPDSDRDGEADSDLDGGSEHGSDRRARNRQIDDRLPGFRRPGEPPAGSGPTGAPASTDSPASDGTGGLFGPPSTPTLGRPPEAGAATGPTDRRDGTEPPSSEPSLWFAQRPHRPPTPPPDVPSLLDSLDTFGAQLPDDDERFTPPAPPPLPNFSKYGVAGVLAVFGGFVLFVFPTLLPLDPDFVMLFGFTCILAGFVTLVWRLRPGDEEEDDSPDNGAVV